MDNLLPYVSDLIRDFHTYPFLLRTLLASILVGLTCSFLSVFVVLKKLAFIGQGISHAAFGGIALGFWLFPALTTPNLSVYGITVGFCMLVAFGIALTSRTEMVSDDSAIGIYFAASMALGVIFMSLRANYTTEVFHFLFGTVLAVTPEDLYYLTGLAILVFGAGLLHFKEFYAYCFDPLFAEVIGINTSFLHYLLLSLLALTIVLAVKVVGVIMVTAFLVIPGACARQMTLRFKWMVFFSLLVGIFSSVVGVLLSNSKLDLPPGALIVAVQFAIFLLLQIVQRMKLFFVREP